MAQIEKNQPLGLIFQLRQDSVSSKEAKTQSSEGTDLGTQMTLVLVGGLGPVCMGVNPGLPSKIEVIC